MGKGSFVFYTEWLDHLGLLSPADAMMVLQAVRDYIDTGRIAELGGAPAMAFSFIRAQIDRDVEKWEDIKKKRSEAGRHGARASNEQQKAAKAANAGFAEQHEANPAVNVDVNVNGNVNVPSKECGCMPRARRFVPPSLEDVTEYVKIRNSSVDPQGFIDFYASKGWMIGKTPMKDWKAACRNAEGWERWKKSPGQRDRIRSDDEYAQGGDLM